MRVIFVLTMLFFTACSQRSDIEYKALNITPQDTSTLKISLGVKKPLMPPYLLTKKITYLQGDYNIRNVAHARWIEPFDESLQSSLTTYLLETFPRSKIAQYPWGFYKEPAWRLQLYIESVTLHENILMLKARYELEGKKVKRAFFQTKIALREDISYEYALETALNRLYNDIARFIEK